MKEIFILLLICFVFNTLEAQEKILEQKIEFNSSNIKSHFISNPLNDNLASIIIDKENILLQLMDENFNIIQSLTTKKPNIRSLDYINHYYESGIYYIYLTNKSTNKSSFSRREYSIYYVISFDISNNSVTQQKFSTPNYDCKYLSSFKRNGRLCMMFVARKPSLGSKQEIMYA